MLGYSQMQQREFGQEHAGYRATKHQGFVGTGYFDAVQTAITAGETLRRARWRAAPRRNSSTGRRRPPSRNVWSPKDHAAAIAEHFRAYNEEFGRITRRAALNFLAEDWRAAQQDAVARIELYEQRVTRCVEALAEELKPRATDSRALGRDQARLRDAGRAAPRQRFLPHVLQLGHAAICSAPSG